MELAESRDKIRARSFGRRWARKVRIIFRRALREHSSPTRTALGFGSGCFIGVFPSFLLGSPLAFFLAGRMRLNRAAAVAGTLMTNPVTAPVFYSVSAWLGAKILTPVPDGVKIEGMMATVKHFGLSFLVGNTIFALGFAALAGTALFVFLWATKRGAALAPGTSPTETK